MGSYPEHRNPITNNSRVVDPSGQTHLQIPNLSDEVTVPRPFSIGVSRASDHPVVTTYVIVRRVIHMPVLVLSGT